MAQKNNSKGENFFEEIVKKTKTGVTFPKYLREKLFKEDKEVFFRIIVPKEKDKIILEILPEEHVKELSEKLKAKKPKTPSAPKEIRPRKPTKVAGPSINWTEIFLYDFKSKDKVHPILEAALHKFSQSPPNLKDAMGRVKYCLVSFLSSIKTENAKLYFTVAKFLIKIIEKFNQPNLIEWIYEKIIPNIESKFLYELTLLELVEVSLKSHRFEKSEIFLKEILENIDSYPKSELYNVMNSFKQLVKKVRRIELPEGFSNLIKEKLIKYEKTLDTDYKIQIIELLEDLKFIEEAYNLAKEIKISLPPDSIKTEEVHKLIRRLKEKPLG